MFRGAVVSAAALVALLAVAGYCPLPQSMEDRYRAMLYLGLYKVVEYWSFEVIEGLGFGSFYDHIQKVQRLPEWDPEGPPLSAAYSDLEVFKDTIQNVKVIIYRPKDLRQGKRLPGLVYLHGGGWTVFPVDVFDRTLNELAACSRMVLISVDYRLAPEYSFPTPVQDCLDVTKFVLEHGDKYNIDTTRVGIAGDSAGGNMAAAITLHLTKHKSSTNLPPLQYQALLYPATQVLTLRLPSMRELGEIVPLPSWDRMAAYWALYMGLGTSNMTHYARVLKQNRHMPSEVRDRYSKFLDVENLPERFRSPRAAEMSGRVAEAADYYQSEPGIGTSYDAEVYNKIKDKVTDPLMSPLLAPDVTGVPSALVVTSEFDPLRDDGLLYAKRLRDAGVDTQEYMSKGYHDDYLKVFPGFLHSRTGIKSMEKICAFIKQRA